jgi:hypothetical protein
MSLRSGPPYHNAAEVLMGTTQDSDLVASCADADPASFPAGRAVRRPSDGTLSLSTGSLIGVSLGKSLSDTAKTSVARTGNRVPLQLSGYAYLTKDELTFWKKSDVPVAIEFVDDGATAGSEAVTVTGDDEAVWLISLDMDVLSTATQCKAALDADEDAAALIETFITGTAGNAQAAFAEDDIDVEPVIGAAVRVSATDGRAVSAGGTLTGACYASNTMTGIDPDGGSSVPVALIDMGGGL